MGGSRIAWSRHGRRCADAFGREGREIGSIGKRQWNPQVGVDWVVKGNKSGARSDCLSPCRNGR
ncbi:TPA: hypothetical protein WMD16_001075 [Neisseria gonorrhoeae]